MESHVNQHRYSWIACIALALAVVAAAIGLPRSASAACGPANYGTPGCPYPSLGGSDTFRTNTNRPGSDYANFDLKGAYPSDCRDACLKDAACKAWTYVKPGVQGPKARCWLKNAAPGERPDECCVSGINPATASAPAPAPASSKPIKKFGRSLSADAKAALNAHNGYRAKHCVPALSWSSDLAKQAQAWASGCAPSGGGFAHSPGAFQGGYGENLAWGSGLSAGGAVDLWYNEVGQYNFGAPSWSNAVGHFTQVVWRNSKQVGCAMAVCGGQNYWVCRYAPPGNWNVNTELANNVPAPCK
jgi:uncharacterized protein YkwD